jgi:hypothetical protein
MKMSILKRQAENKKDDRKGRKFRPSTGVNPAASWERVDAEQLRSTIDAVSRAGGALRLGYTRDGGAYSVGVYGDGPEPYTLFVAPSDNMDEFLAELEQAFSSSDTLINGGNVK